jgi:hypothetical protein
MIGLASEAGAEASSAVEQAANTSAVAISIVFIVRSEFMGSSKANVAQ